MTPHRRHISYLSRVLPAVILLGLGTGCFSTNRPFPEITHYALSAERGDAQGSSEALYGGLLVSRFTASPAAAGKEFLLRTGENSLEQDFYNRLHLPPADLVRSETVKWLDESGLFASIHYTDTAAPAPWYLEGHVIAMEADPSGQAQATLKIQFSLLKLEQNPELVLTRTYEESVPLTDRNPDGIIAAWNQALAEILSQFEQALLAEAPV